MVTWWFIQIDFKLQIGEKASTGRSIEKDWGILKYHCLEVGLLCSIMFNPFLIGCYKSKSFEWFFFGAWSERSIGTPIGFAAKFGSPKSHLKPHCLLIQVGVRTVLVVWWISHVVRCTRSLHHLAEIVGPLAILYCADSPTSRAIPRKHSGTWKTELHWNMRVFFTPILHVKLVFVWAFTGQLGQPSNFQIPWFFHHLPSSWWP